MAEDLVGKIIGNYEILGELGRGGMGVVYKAHEQSLGRAVALKVLPPNLAADEAFLKRFTREARAVAQLNHPNVVTIYNIGQEGATHYIAMEFIRGRVLSDMIKEKGRIELRPALHIARQVADALGAAHRSRIIHRDIKPQNIMVDEGGRVKVMDFGIAKMTEEMATSLTRTGDVLGTPAYMSPEQCRGKQLDGRTDIYSLGIVLFQMLAGTLPFKGETPVTVIQKILFEPAPSVLEFNPNVPPSVVRLLDRCLSKEVEDRYPSSLELSADLDAAISGREPSVGAEEEQPTTVSDKPPKAVSRPGHQARALEPRGASIPSGAGAPEDSEVRSSILQGLTVGGVVAALAIGGLIFGVRYLTAPKSSLENAAEVNRTPPPLATADLSKPIIQPPTKQETPPPHTEKPPKAEEIPPSATGISLASRLSRGLVPKMSDEEAREFLARGEGTGDPVAKMMLARARDRGLYGLPRDPDSAAKLAADSSSNLEKLARNNDPDAMYLLGAAREHGLGQTQDPSDAARWYRRAADSGHPEAMKSLGWMYDSGSGVAKDPREAVNWYKKGAEKGNLAAMHNLAVSYEEGTGVESDPVQAAQWYRRAAEMGEPSAMFNLAECYASGSGVPQSDSQALDWYRKAADAGDASAMTNLGWIYETGRGVKQDDAAAAQWYRRGADAGDPVAMTNLAAMCDEGRGVERNPKEAVALNLKAAQFGNPRGMYNLGVSFDRGEGLV
ncbi:SEL1-like repeat protein, partial [Candidatus Sumerlaeota bacterium]|nr:SEL1-like repeat protein [Candidatus Sumerlaeota bacterium]